MKGDRIDAVPATLGRSLVSIVYSRLRSVIILAGLLLACNAISAAQAPLWSRGVQLMNMSLDECKKRAQGALETAGYRIENQGGSFREDYFFAGTKGINSAAIACNLTSNNYLWVNIFVGSIDRGAGQVAGTERVNLQTLMERPGPISGGGGGGEGRCQGVVTYSISAPSTARPYEQITVNFTAPSNHDERAWIGIFQAGENPPKNYLDWKYVGAKDQCFGTMSLRVPAAGSYALYFFSDSQYDKIVARAGLTVQGQGQAQMANPEPSSGRGCQGSSLTLALSSYNIRAGQVVAARVTVPGGNPPTGSWIGLFPANGTTNYIAWQYLTDPDVRQANFTKNFKLDRPGQYEIRTYLDSGYDKVASRCYVTVQ